MNKFLKNSGIGLLQVVLAIAVLGSVSLVITKSVTNNMKAIKSDEFKTEAEEYLNQINILLSNRSACINSLGGLNSTNSADFNSLRNHIGAGTIVLNQNSFFGDTGVKIESMKLEDLPGLSDGVNVVNNGFGTTNLILTFSDRQGTFFNKNNLTRKIKINVRTSAAGLVDSTCYSATYSPPKASNAVGALWKRQAADNDSIAYVGGNVGVQTNSPQEIIDIQGNLQVQQDGDIATPVIVAPFDKLTFSDFAATYLLTANADKPLIFKLDTGAEADFGARIVHANRGMILGSGGTCTALSEGAIRYGTVSRRVEVCRAGVWRMKKVIEYCLAEDVDDPVANRSKYNDDEATLLKDASHGASAWGPKGLECGFHQTYNHNNAKGADNNFAAVNADPDIPRNSMARPATQVLRFDDADHWTPCFNTRSCQDWIPSHQ